MDSCPRQGPFESFVLPSFVAIDNSGEFVQDDIVALAAVFVDREALSAAGRLVLDARYACQYYGPLHFADLATDGSKGQEKTCMALLDGLLSASPSGLHVKTYVIRRHHPTYERRRFSTSPFDECPPHVIEHNFWLKSCLKAGSKRYYADHAPKLSIIIDQNKLLLSCARGARQFRLEDYLRDELVRDGVLVDRVSQAVISHEQILNPVRGLLDLADLLAGASRQVFLPSGSRVSAKVRLGVRLLELVKQGQADAELRTRLDVSVFPGDGSRFVSLGGRSEDDWERCGVRDSVLARVRCGTGALSHSL